MSFPILDKLPEHLNTIEQLKKNSPKLLLSALLYTESELIINRYQDEKERIDVYLQFINAATDHDGNCVKESAPCILCHALDSIICTEETLEEGREVFQDLSEEDLILRLVEVVLLTQPEKRFNSEEERRKLTKDLSFIDFHNQYQEYYGYEDDTGKRIAIWQEKDVKEKERIRDLIQELLHYI